ncbi:CPBP family intramembrane glutamic endopeptidase [Butyrivibrio sp. LC3010]|uniref:CPBP family intramembrane glutamic endopeptidase n=1 Tax=Butyrivibrio sp. LC3010 TaxID=1280680 RepID=UPI0004227762|nr:CPBP family intramembrane glutamic endopeptidase [Butyrivibrio sp. LC3010]
MLKKYIEFMKRSPLITAALCIVYVVVCFKSVPTQTHFQFFIVRTMLCGAACFFLYQISGDKTLSSSYNSTSYVLKYSVGFLIVAFSLGTIVLVSDISEKRPLLQNPVLELFVVFLMYMSVGLFEELSFRAVINDAIIYKFRNWKYVFVLGAVVSSLVFGAVHVLGGFDPLSAMAWGQAIGKTLEASLFGLALLILYWKTRNIWACGLAHGLNDFLTDYTSGLFIPEEGLGSYVRTGEDAAKLLLVYVGLIVINLVFVLIIWKKVGKTIDFEKIRREW